MNTYRRAFAGRRLRLLEMLKKQGQLRPPRGELREIFFAQIIR
jgi:hypothetical protein